MKKVANEFPLSQIEYIFWGYLFWVIFPRHSSRGCQIPLTVTFVLAMHLILKYVPISSSIWYSNTPE